MSSSNQHHSHKEKWMDKIMKCPSKKTQKLIIPKVPKLLLRDPNDYEKYYVPRVVSLGPYHHGNKELEFIEDIKPMITNKFVNGDEETLEGMYNSLYSMIKTVRSYYEEKSICDVPDDEFTTRMLQDGCFILYFFANYIINDIAPKDEVEDLGLKSHHVAFIQHDLVLLENQVPFIVLEELVKSRKDVKWGNAIDLLVSRSVEKDKCKTNCFLNCCITGSGKQTEDTGSREEKKPAHILEIIQRNFVGEDPPTKTERVNRYTFRNVNELLTVGIRFRPSNSSGLADIKYRSCGFSASVEIQPISIDDNTKPMLLNLVAYEMCENAPNESWVTSYICFLDSLIDHADDVKELRKAGILHNYLGSDQQVAELFNEIGTYLVEDPCSYAKARDMIQKHYIDKKRTYIWQLKNEYFKNPWSIVALCGALVLLFLSIVQTYFSVWSIPGECDHVCKYIKQNHHL